MEARAAHQGWREKESNDEAVKGDGGKGLQRLVTKKGGKREEPATGGEARERQ